MTDDAQHAPSLSLSHGVQLFLLVAAAIAAWIYLAGVVLPASGFAGFLLLWYWATVEKAAFERLVPSLIGALVGVGLAWLFILLPPSLGMGPGLGAAYAVSAAALFVIIMNWAPVALNGATMLFLTVLGAPALITTVKFTVIAESVVSGAVFFGAIVYAATLYVRMRSKPAL